MAERIEVGSMEWIEAIFGAAAVVRDENDTIRRAARDLAHAIACECPPSADRTTALRKLREAVMTANASIALGGIA